MQLKKEIQKVMLEGEISKILDMEWLALELGTTSSSILKLKARKIFRSQELFKLTKK